MKVGDLVKVRECPGAEHCTCFFCLDNSNCIGIVLNRREHKVANWDGATLLTVLFDVGEWEVYTHEAELISASR